MKLHLLLCWVPLLLTMRVVRGGVCKQRFYPHPFDCQKYLDCHMGNRVLKCRNKLRWNQKRQYCDWPNNVKCKKGPKVYLTKTAHNEKLEINWLELDRTTLPTDTIILRKNGNYITGIQPSKHPHNNYRTDIEFARETLDSTQVDALKQKCFGDYTVEWLDESKDLIAEGCLKANPNWMQENYNSIRNVNVGDLILSGTQYSGMYSTEEEDFNVASILITDPKCLIWGLDCPEHFKNYLNSKPDNLVVAYLFYRIHCEYSTTDCPAYIETLKNSAQDVTSNSTHDNLYTELMSFKEHELMKLADEYKPALYSIYEEYFKTYFTAISFPLPCPIEEMFEEEMGNILINFILPKFQNIFAYLRNNWFVHHHENILEQLVLGVRYQDIRLLYDSSSDNKFWMGKGCFKGHSINSGVNQLKTFLKSTQEIVFWEVNIEKTGGDYVCGENSLQWNQDVVDQFVAFLEDELSDWILKPNDKLLKGKSIWNSRTGDILRKQRQGKIILITHEEKFLQTDLFFNKISTKNDEVSLLSSFTAISPEFLYNSIADFKKGNSRVFTVSLIPSLKDFSPLYKAGIQNVLDFSAYVVKEVLDIVPTVYRELPAEVIKQFWEIINTTVENLFGVMDSIFGAITVPLKEFTEEAFDTFKNFFDEIKGYFENLFAPVLQKIEVVTNLMKKVTGDINNKLDTFRYSFRTFENMYNSVLSKIEKVTDLIDNFEIPDVGGGIFKRRKRRDVDSSRLNTTDTLSIKTENTTIRKKRSVSDISNIIEKLNIEEIVDKLDPDGIFDEPKEELMKIFPSLWSLLKPITNLGLKPMELLYEKSSEKLATYSPMLQPYCRTGFLFEVDVLIRTAMVQEIVPVPPPFNFASKLNIEVGILSLLDVLSNRKETLPGLKTYADLVNSNVTKIWRENSLELSDVFVSLHTYIPGTNMIQENIERLITKADYKD